MCTLLGPEGPGAGGCWLAGFSGLRLSDFRVWWFRYRPYVENYTVDASILDARTSGSGVTNLWSRDSFLIIFLNYSW